MKKGTEIAFKCPKVWIKCPNFSPVFLIGLLPCWSWKEIYRTNEIMFNHPILKLTLFPWIIGCFQTSFEPLLTPFDHFLWNFLLIICGGAAKASHLKPLPADKHCNLRDTVSFSTSDQQSILRITLQGREKQTSP